MRASDPLLGEKNVNSKKTLKTVFMVLGLLSVGCVLLYSSYHHDEDALGLHNEMETLDAAEIIAEIQDEEPEQDGSFPDPVMYNNEDETKMSKTTEDWHVDHAANRPEPNTLCGGAYDRGVGTVPDQCKDGDVKEVGMCYNKACPSGYTTVAASCFENCPKGYTDVGLTCVTKSAPKVKPQYIRKPYVKPGCDSGFRLTAGACYRDSCRDEYSEADNIRCASCGGNKWEFFARKTMCKKKKNAANIKHAKTYLRTPNNVKCPSGAIEGKIAGVKWCYPKCRDGYKSISGWGCQKNCDAGQIDLGAFCQDKDIVEQKDIIVRKGYIPSGCGSNKRQQAGLCYTPCKTGFNGVGPLCFLDLGKFVKQKEDEFKGYLKIFNIYQGGDCFSPRIESIKTEIQKLNFDAADVGQTLLNILKATFKTGSFSTCLKKKFEQWRDSGLWDFRYLAFGIEYAVSLGIGPVGGSGSVGIAIAPTYNGGVMDFSADGIKILAYTGGCLQFAPPSGIGLPSVTIGGDYTFVINRSMGDILGSTFSFGIKGSVSACSGVEVSVGGVLGLAPNTCQVSSIGLTIGAALSSACPGELSVGMAWCGSEKIASTSFEEREAVIFGEKVKVGAHIRQIFTEDGPVEIY